MPGYCVTTEAGRQHITEVIAAGDARIRTEDGYWHFYREYWRGWEVAAKDAALSDYELARAAEVLYWERRYYQRNEVYQTSLREINARYEGRVLAIHYEDKLRWWRPLNREYRVFQRYPRDPKVCNERSEGCRE